MKTEKEFVFVVLFTISVCLNIIFLDIIIDYKHYLYKEQIRLEMEYKKLTQ